MESHSVFRPHSSFGLCCHLLQHLGGCVSKRGKCVGIYGIEFTVDKFSATEMLGRDRSMVQVIIVGLGGLV